MIKYYVIKNLNNKKILSYKKVTLFNNIFLGKFFIKNSDWMEI